jgi:retron-type reverse transcriptase
LHVLVNIGRIPSKINEGLITPLIKDTQKSSPDLNNIRPIMLSNTMAIIIEKFFLNDMAMTLELSEFQYGFRKNFSCSHAVFVMRETIISYMSKKKPVYCLAIDFTKAFDKLNRNVLFQQLAHKIAPRIWLGLYKLYLSTTARVRNNNELSGVFRTTRGVKQGGPLSPFLFALYIDQMLKHLANQPGVCKIGNRITGVIAYADDIMILCESLNELQNLANQLYECCEELDMVINIDKTKSMVFW